MLLFPHCTGNLVKNTVLSLSAYHSPSREVDYQKALSLRVCLLGLLLRLFAYISR